MPSPSPITTGELRVLPVLGIRDVFAGDSVAKLVVDALALGGLRFHEATSSWSSTRSYPRRRGDWLRSTSVKAVRGCQ